jgi:hypothetical protein
VTRLLDDALPAFDVTEVHDTWIPALPEVAFGAVRAVTVGEIRLLIPLMALRTLPGLVRGRGLDIRPSLPVLESMERAGFVPLGDRPPHETALGVIGKFWQIDSTSTFRRFATVDELAAFAEPGYAKAAIDFRVTAEGPGSRITTETRIQGTDPEATKLFGRYWRLISLGSGVIRISWLNAIRRRVGD